MVHDDTWFFSTNVSRDVRRVLPDPTLETIQRLFAEQVGLLGVHEEKI
ncbi:MAG TPA: hypothetical protein VL485_25365 [Ktedonobacteraceae bacterium]|jgi:hypothetical protein|nr:hypothetical protein [Ktedonobacteraceae bacterium]